MVNFPLEMSAIIDIHWLSSEGVCTNFSWHIMTLRLTIFFTTCMHLFNTLNSKQVNPFQVKSIHTNNGPPQARLPNKFTVILNMKMATIYYFVAHNHPISPHHLIKIIA